MEGPFDIQGGLGFFEKNSFFLTGAKKIKCLQQC